MPSSIKPLFGMRQNSVKAEDPECYKTFIADLKEAMPNASLFIPGKNKCYTLQECHLKSCCCLHHSISCYKS